jgi:signal transduction histidine kinase
MEIAMDITEIKMLEKMRMDLVSVLTHEIRTPLTAMIGYTELLLEQKVEAALQETCLYTIQKETKRLNELIDDFLDLQRLEATLITHDHAVLHLPQLLQQAADLFFAASENHTIVVDCPPDLPPTKGDEKQLSRVFRNLVSNAIKYSPDGGTVSVGARQDGEELVVWVKDEGMGIPPESLEKVFEKFYRVGTPAHRKVPGTGLGLALVRETVEAHGGRVWVESEPGKGSTFYVSLPVSPG